MAWDKDKDQLKGVHNWLSFDRGYIIYNKANNGNSDLSGWEFHRQLEEAAGTKYFNTLKRKNELRETIEAGGQMLQAMADAERSKEEAWLHSLYPGVDFPDDELQYIKTINEIYTGEAKFDRLLSRLLYNMDRNAKIAEKNREIEARNSLLPEDAEKESKLSTLRAPSMIVNYIDYFAAAFRDWIERYVAEGTMDDVIKLAKGNTKIWDKGFKTASEEAFERIAAADHTENSKNFGEGEDYYELIDLMKSNKAFKKFLYNQLHIANVQKELSSYLLGEDRKGIKMQDYRKQNRKKLVSDRKKSDLMTINKVKDLISSGEQSTRQMAGFIQEFVKVNLMKELSTEHGKRVKGESLSNINATDTLLIQTEVSVSIGKVYKKLIEATKSNSQADIAKELKKFYKHWRGQERKKFFVVNTSNKLYTLTENHRFKKDAKVSNLENVLKYNFTSTRGGSHESMPGYDYFTNSRDIHMLTSLIYNTMTGAFLDKKKSAVIDTLRQILATGAANLLFSDYYNIGDSQKSVNAIHLFDLDDVYIPLSIVLQGMADAYLEAGQNNYTKYIQLSEFSTGEILYPKKKGQSAEERYGDQPMSVAWNTQRDAARQQATFEIRFVNNFQETIKKIAQEYGMIKINKGGKFDFL